MALHTMEMKFSVPGAPKGKARPRVTRSGHAFTPKDTVLYENLVKTSFAAAYPDQRPIDSEITAVIYAYYPIPASTSKKRKQLMASGDIKPVTKPDTDNIAKAILDSLNGIAYSDDSRITDLTVMKRYSEIPRVFVMLKWQEERSNDLEGEESGETL